MNDKPVVGIIGLGAMGGAIARALGESFMPTQLFGYDHQLNQADGLAIKRAGSARELCERSDMILIAVKPQQIDELIAKIAPIEDKLLVSIAAGVTISRLTSFGATRIVRAMPNLAALAGASLTGWVASAEVTLLDRSTVQEIFATFGLELELADESTMDALTAVSGSGPGYLMAMAEALTTAAESVGFSTEQAELIVRQTLIGGGALLAADTRSFAALKRAVTSKGGITEAAFVAMPEAELTTLMSRAVIAGTDRARSLGKQS